MNAEELREILQEKGIDWLIAAMVEGSIGYHSPKHAKRLVEEALSGQTKDYCERCSACYGSDLPAMIDSDIKMMKYLEEQSPKRFQRVIEAVKQLSRLSTEGQTVAGLMYPTMGV